MLIKDYVLDVFEVKTRAQMNDFIGLPYEIYRGHETWTPPLRFMEKQRFNPRTNPGLRDIEVTYWVAYARGICVGRCASFVNHAHLRQYQDNTGHFGFLDTDLGHPEAIDALLQKSADWLRAKGMVHMAGPFNFSVNEECGMLIDGFDTPQMMLMPHGRRDYPIAMEALGFEKAMDTYAYVGRLHENYPRPPILPRMQKMIADSKSLSLRPMRKDRFKEEIDLAMDIFNDAWSDNWGFIPYSDEQVQHMAGDLKLIIEPDGVWFAEVDGVAKGFVMLIPNLNEAIRDLDGRLFPFGWAKMLYRLKTKRVTTGRIPLMGIRQDIQKKKVGVTLMITLFEAVYAAMRRKGVRTAELSWILETNRDVQKLIALSSAEVYKTYRIYKKAL